MQGDVEDKNLPSLHDLACKNEVDKIVRKLQSIHASDIISFVNQKDERDWTPLLYATYENRGQSHLKVIEILLENGADPNVKDKYRRTPLGNLLEQYCDLKIFKLFKKFNADFTSLDEVGSPPLLKVIENSNRLEDVKFMVEDVGLDINRWHEVKKSFVYTPLHWGVFSNKDDSHYEILEYLLEIGADPNARGRFDETPFFCLFRRNANSKVINLFLKYNVNVNQVSTHRRETLLFEFNSKNSDVRILDKLINGFGLDVNHRNFRGETALHFFMKEKRVDIKAIAKCLVKNGANVNIPDNWEVLSLVNAVRKIRHHQLGWFMENLDYLNFIIDLTDFSVVPDYGQHILMHYSFKNEEDHNRDIDYYRLPEFVWKWIVEHFAKLKFLNIPIHPMDMLENAISVSEDDEYERYFKISTEELGRNHYNLYKKYFAKCTEELEVMSNTKLPNSWLTFFHLLVGSRRKLKNYAGNEDLIQDYENNDWLGKFTIYGASLKKIMDKGIRRRKLFDKSCVLLSDCLPIFNPNHLIIKDILDCIMSKKDLAKFCS